MEVFFWQAVNNQKMAKSNVPLYYYNSTLPVAYFIPKITGLSAQYFSLFYPPTCGYNSSLKNHVKKSSEHTCSKKILNTGTYSSNSSNFSVKVQTKTMKYDHEVSLYRFDLAKYSCRTKFHVEIHFAQKYIKQKYHYLLLKLSIHAAILRIVLYLIVLLTMLHLTRLL